MATEDRRKPLRAFMQWTTGNCNCYYIVVCVSFELVSERLALQTRPFSVEILFVITNGCVVQFDCNRSRLGFGFVRFLRAAGAIDTRRLDKTVQEIIG